MFLLTILWVKSFVIPDTPCPRQGIDIKCLPRERSWPGIGNPGVIDLNIIIIYPSLNIKRFSPWVPAGVYARRGTGMTR